MEVCTPSTTMIREAGANAVLSIGVAVLIWLFGNRFFIPVSEGVVIQGYAVTHVISLITLAALIELMADATLYLASIIKFDLGTDFIIFVLFSIICFLAIMFGAGKSDDEDSGGETACQHMVP